MKPRNPENEYMFALDVVMTMAIVAFVFLFVAMQHQGKNAKDQNKQDEAGHICAEIYWDPTSDTDMDVWGKFNQDPSVGWSNMHGEYMDLLRDDLGNYRDRSPINYEISCTRGLQDGEHTYTVQYFADRRPALIPFSIKATVTVYPPNKSDTRFVIEKQIDFSTIKQEKTIANFVVEKGKVLPDTINDMDHNIGPTGEMIPPGYGG